MDPSERDASSGPSDDGPEHDRGRKRNVGLFVGLGCFGVIVLSCCLLSYWAQEYGFQWVLDQDDEVRATVARGLTGAALQGIAGTCADGAPSEDAARWFHPDLPAAERNLVCSLEPSQLEQIGSEELAPASTLSASGDAELAQRYQLDPDDCYRYQTETFTVVGCFDRGPEAPAIPFRIIELRSASE